MDEVNEKERLAFLLPSHELFHQSMVVADCESQLFRDNSRGLEGGAYFQATILQRKEAKTGKGKDSIDALSDMLLLKADVRFNHYFIMFYNLSLCDISKSLVNIFQSLNTIVSLNTDILFHK